MTSSSSSHSNPQKLNISQQFVPLENNPEVLTTLIHKLGLSPSLSFHDVFSLDDPSLLAFIPRPALALLLVFPVSKIYESLRVAEDTPLPQYAGYGSEEEILWFRQTIRNACGMMGLLHLVLNGGARDFIAQRISALTAPNTPLSHLITAAVPLNPTERARLIETSPDIAEAHAAAAEQGATAAPDASADVDLHFVAFVKTAQNHLWELDGRRKGPLNRGSLDESDDVLSEKALQMGVKRFLKEAGEDLRFSLLALAPALD